MNKNFFLIAFRNIKRNKVFSFLNIGGLAIGIAACMISLLFVKNEYDFDRMHKKGNRIFRLSEIQNLKGMTEQTTPLSMFPMAPALQKDYPYVQAAVRIGDNDAITLRAGDRQLLSDHIINADSSFFNVFDFPLLQGDPSSALKEPDNIIVTQALAKKLFDKTDVAGKVLQLNRNGSFENFTISAVLADIPESSHLRFEAILPMQSVKMQSWMNTWDANWVNTYLLLGKASDKEILTAAFPAFEKKYLGEQDDTYTLFLQPLYSIHLDSENITHDGNNYNKFSRRYVNIFLYIAIFVLLIAVLNFVNLATARATQRAKEVGVRKTIGASRWQLMRQFTNEAVLVSLLAFLVAIIITAFSLPLINKIIDRNMSVAGTSSPLLWVFFVLTAIAIGILAGVYPAIVISAYKPVKVLKGIIRTGSNRSFSIRNGLVVIQFSIATVLILSTLVMVQQLRYINKKDIGFDKEQVMIISMNATANKNYEALKNGLQKKANVLDVTAFSSRLGNNIGQMGAKYLTPSGEEKRVSVSHLVVDVNYLSFFNIKLLQGRGFSKEFSDTAGHSYVINETLAKELETKQVVGTPYAASWLKDMGSVIGVAKDFNFNTLHEKIAPLYISMQNWNYHEMAVRLKAGNTGDGVASVESEWKKLVPDMPLNYSFLDDHINTLYKTDTQVSKVVSILTGLAIIIASLGLFGMALFLIETRTKEIGIRKALGASIKSITGLLSKDFLKPVFISLVLSLPLAWYYMNRWLQDFAYRIHIHWSVFLIAGLSAVLIALVTISFQAIKAAIANPVKSLRTE